MSFSLNTQFAMEPSVRRETQLAQEAAGLTDPVPQVVAAGKFAPLPVGGYGLVPIVKANGIKLTYVEDPLGGGMDYYVATFVSVDPVTKEELPAPRPDCDYQVFVSPYTLAGVDTSVATLQNIALFPCDQEGFQFAVWQDGARVSAPLSIQVVDFNVPPLPIV